MIAPDQAASSEPSAAQPDLKTSLRSSLPGVFLMINSFETGGSERQFVALARSLSADAFRLHLGCVMQKGSFMAGLGEVPAFGLGGSLYRWQSVKSRIRLARHLRTHHIQVAHSFDFYTNLTLIPAARLAGVPVVIGSQRQLGDLLTKAQSRVQTAMFRFSDAVVCNSRAAADLLAQRGLPESKTIVIGNGLPSSVFERPEPALPRLPGILRVGMIARMNTPSKNHTLFLQAAAELCSRNSKVEFVFVGDGPLRPQLEREAEVTRCRERVLFLGDRRDIPAVLASLDISVLPSASESLSNVILESMAAGLPVIASRVGGNVELLSENRGVLVEHGDASVLANAIEGLLRDPGQRNEMGSRARQFTKANFTLENMRQRHEDLYLDLLARKNWRAKTMASAGRPAGR